MIIGTNALEQLVSRAVGGRKTVDEVSQDAFSAVAAAGLTSGTAPVTQQIGNSTSQDSKQDSSGYNESFARMMINLKSAGDTSLSEKTGDRDNGFTGSVANVASTTDTGSTGSVEQKFMDALKQTAEEKVREKLTGISQKSYDAMAPQDQLAIDQKVQDALKDKQNDVADDINTRIRGIKAGMVA
ncbi:hypothetical protein ACKUFS_09675 [Pseudomonas cannabina]|uniref:Uncharacterized protein n=3 Tax=Pseudomonas syringae group TaxID=136849 RepID=A0A3M3QQD9_PSECA|nr:MULTISPECIES: hypothetical protein [Pseudomonas syringae group]KPB77370.1 Uncharacterized protein AC507_4964 [Pseudomonas syringae pv. maculicola]KPW23341.1 hypothetical protein ALO83_100106 [Pseudomonas cannabina pv. alisalensis]MBM0140006.1 hypothetical protein [Pseudomonas cannabina pv. alisalensis]QHE97132.1 hypothetical protein PMA4326_011255 [Pseudomonas syringae pv. maculicola str. ES4326]QQN19787.1 hypothetical protein JGS08_14065 [Pseudomonas cannabina pv. alisalensis]